MLKSSPKRNPESGLNCRPTAAPVMKPGRRDLSIDIADIDIGRNIGASLQIDQANADKNIAQAKAEERRAMAVALEQEMKAKAEEARANVIQAEAEVPKAMAEAFRSGNLGIMDYYRMKNIQADTDMRSSIARPDSHPAGHEPIGK